MMMSALCAVLNRRQEKQVVICCCPAFNNPARIIVGDSVLVCLVITSQSLHVFSMLHQSVEQ